MTLDLTWQDATALWQDAVQRQAAPIISIDGLETVYTLPPQIGNGYHRVIRLQPGIELDIFDCTYHDVALQISENQHPVQFMVHLSGILDSGDRLYQDANWSYVGGSGVQRSLTSFFSESERHIGLNINLQPHLFAQFLGTSVEALPNALQPLMSDPSQHQQVFSPQSTGMLRSVVQQIIDCPLSGANKRLYLQGKLFELMALQLDAITDAAALPKTVTLKPDTLVRVHQAAAILRSHLEAPPNQTDLAEQVGLCDRTLRRGFKQIFGITLGGYLTQQRLQQAERSLRQGNCTVAEVANQVGYGHLGHFAAAFKQQFGITPSQCLNNRRSSA